MLEILCVAVVDDTDLLHSGNSNYTSGAEVTLQMQSVLNHWDNLIRATGGALEKSKSYWYLLDYIYQQGKWTYKPTNLVPGQIYPSSMMKLRRRNPSTAYLHPLLEKRWESSLAPPATWLPKLHTWLRKPKHGPHPCKLVAFAHTRLGTA
jgi:hypothetical protein